MTTKFNLHPSAEAGISNYLNQTEKYSMGGSTEGPIYSTIDATNENLNGFTYAQDISTAPYASTSIMPFTNQAQPSSCEQQQDDAHWIPQAGPSGAQYAQPDRCTGEGLDRRDDLIGFSSVNTDLLVCAYQQKQHSMCWAAVCLKKSSFWQRHIVLQWCQCPRPHTTLQDPTDQSPHLTLNTFLTFVYYKHIGVNGCLNGCLSCPGRDPAPPYWQLGLAGW